MASKGLQKFGYVLQQTARQSTQIGIASAVRDDKNKWLDVQWTDGKSGKFPYLWLKDNCPADHSYHITDLSKARLTKLYELPLDLEPTKVNQDPTGVNITWPDNKSAIYDSEWLRKRNIGDRELVKERKDVMMHKKELWNRTRYTQHVKYHDFEKVLTDDLACHNALTDIVDWGLVFFNNIKPEPGQLARLSEHLGFHFKTHYGDRFSVKYKTDPTNLGNETNQALELHTDHAYQETPPDVQMLHCIENFGAGKGGESVFSDAFNAAHVISKERPDLYRILCDVQLEYVDEGVDFMPFDTFGKWPVFNFDKDGYLTKVVFNNHMRSWFLDVGPERVREVYEAIKYFRDTVHDEKNSFKTQLRGGQMVAFDNNRVMHGRTGFEVNAETQRHLEGMFFAWDVIKSRVRVLRDKLRLPGNHISV